MQGIEHGCIHPTALVSENTSLGANLTVGAHPIIYDGVRLGDDVVVGPECILGEPLASYYADPVYANPPLVIGRGALIRSGSIIYAGSEIGEGFECGHRVTIRERTRIGSHTRVGTLSDIQGHCRLGCYVRLHSNVHIGQCSEVGNYVWIFPYSVLTNDPHPPSNVNVGVVVEDYAVIATMVVVLPGLRIGKDALVGAKALVTTDVAAEAVVVGSPARQVGTIRDIRSKVTGEQVYPWREHFERGMPWEGVGYETWAGTVQALTSTLAKS